MRKNLLCLLVPCAVAIFSWGLDALRVMIVTSLAALGAALLGRRIFSGNDNLRVDMNALSSGLLLALFLPASLPSWAAFMGALIALFFGREVFGGLGASPFHPVAVGGAFLHANFPLLMRGPALVEAIPLAALLGGGALLVMKNIRWELPFFYLGTLFALSFIFRGSIPLFSGLAFLAAFFLVTDPVTTPLTRSGMRFFAVLSALLTAGLGFLNVPVAATFCFGILVANGCVPWIDHWIRPALSKAEGPRARA